MPDHREATIVAQSYLGDLVISDGRQVRLFHVLEGAAQTIEVVPEVPPAVGFAGPEESDRQRQGGAQ